MGEKIGLLYRHRDSAKVSALALSAENLVASGDDSGNFAICDLNTALSSTIDVSPVIHWAQTRDPVRDLYFMPGVSLFLVASPTIYSMFSLEGTCRSELESHGRSNQRSHWVLDHGNSDRESRLFHIDDDNWILRQFDIQKFPERAGPGDIHLDFVLDDPPRNVLVSVANIYSNILVLDIRSAVRYTNRCWLLLFDLRDAREDQAGELHLSPLPLASRLATKVRRPILPRPDGASQDQLLFLSDTNWVAGVSLDKQDAKMCAEYFPVPNEFVPEDGRDEDFTVHTIDDDIAFVLHGELMVVKNGLKYPNTREL